MVNSKFINMSPNLIGGCNQVERGWDWVSVGIRDIALVILPVLMQRVHTRIRRTPPSIRTRTFCKLGNHLRLV